MPHSGGGGGGRGRRRRRRRRPRARAQVLAGGLCREAHNWERMGMYLSERRHEEREETIKHIGQKTCFLTRSRGRETWRTSIRALRPVLVCVPEVPPTGRHARRARRRLDAAQGALRGSKRARGAKGQKGAGEGGRLTFDLSWTTMPIEFFCAVFCGRSPSSCCERTCRARHCALQKSGRIRGRKTTYIMYLPRLLRTLCTYEYRKR